MCEAGRSVCSLGILQSTLWNQCQFPFVSKLKGWCRFCTLLALSISPKEGGKKKPNKLFWDISNMENKTWEAILYNVGYAEHSVTQRTNKNETHTDDPHRGCLSGNVIPLDIFHGDFIA